MIVLDENIVNSQARLLGSWHISLRHIGRNFGRQGMQDDEIIPFLHQLPRVTFVTRDLRFFSRDVPHSEYCLLVLAVEQQEVANFTRRFLKHPDFDSAQKRMGSIVQASHSGLRVRLMNQADESAFPWLKLV